MKYVIVELAKHWGVRIHRAKTAPAIDIPSTRATELGLSVRLRPGRGWLPARPGHQVEYDADADGLRHRGPVAGHRVQNPQRDEGRGGNGETGPHLSTTIDCTALGSKGPARHFIHTGHGGEGVDSQNLIREDLGRVCEGGPRARLRSWAASRRVCGVGSLAGQAHESQNQPLRLALRKRQKPSFLCSRARGGACGRFRAAAGWLARALVGR
jgi:hypothetical protein